MKQIVITLVGTSVLDEQVLPTARPDLGYLARSIRRQAEDKPTALVAKKDADSLAEGLPDHAAWLWDDPRLIDYAPGQRLSDDSAGARRHQEARHGSCGELASLSLLNLQPGDEVWLLASHLPVGALCARLVRAMLLHIQGLARAPFHEEPDEGGVYLPEPWPIPQLELVSPDADGAFVEEALPAYLTKIIDLYELARAAARRDPERRARLIFNVTTGYKGLIPFAALLAAILHSWDPDVAVECPLCYLYQEGSRLIWLDALPITFEGQVVDDHHDLFRAARAGKATAAQADAAFNRAWRETALQPYLREVKDERVGLTPLGQLVWHVCQLRKPPATRDVGVPC